jgi:hypothetical protein
MTKIIAAGQLGRAAMDAPDAKPLIATALLALRSAYNVLGLTERL